MPYWRISGFYLFYFASLGALVPYWSLYLQSLDFSPAKIGELMAVLMATKVVAPNVWGWIADHTGRRMAIVRLASLLSIFAFAGVFFGSDYWWLLLVMMVFSFFWNASLPQFEATTLNHLGEASHGYSRIRVWGSMGFIITVVALGPMLDRFGTTLLLPVLLVLFSAIWISSLLVPERAGRHPPEAHERLRKVLARPEVFAFLVVCFLMQAGHGPYYAFYSIYMQDHDYSRSVIGQLWALGVLAEVGVFLVMHRLLQRYSLRHLLLISVAIAAIRWVLIAFYVDSLGIMIFAQTLHAASFGSYHAAAIHLVHGYFKGRHQGKGQALYSSLSFGAGGALGSLYSGYLWGTAGPTVTYLIAAGVTVLALVVTWLWVRAPDA